MIDFTTLNAFEKGKRDSFESLICILAKREPPNDACEFQPNDGRGGDGGVEAMWIRANGDKIGYQSKFFEALGEAQWKQMDKSVAQALKTHPELKKYVFALPFDLTADRGPKAKGKSEWEKWQDRVSTWKALAKGGSIDLEFELWTATNLAEKVLRDGNASLHKHWFGGDVINDAWFANQVDSAAKKLDDRFNPGDHVEVSIESMFDTIVRGPSTVRRLHEAFDGLASNPVPTIEFTTTSVVPDSAALKAAEQGWDELVAMRSIIDRDHPVDWDWPHAQQILARLQDVTWKLEYSFSSLERKSLEDKDRHKLEAVAKGFRDLSASSNALEHLLHERDFLAEAARCALVFGEAGSGKSHSLGQVASQRVSEGLPTIVVLGQDLSDAPFWPQLGGLLGLEGKSADEILGVLNTVGERKGVRTLLLFDAINEGVGAAYWMHWLPEIIKALRSYPYIAAVFSCRDVYLPYAIPQNLLVSLPKFEVRGFASPDERERAAIQYLDNKGISRPNTPWLSPEFGNPLFLKSTSEALVKKGATEFPRGLHGISQLMALYLDGLTVRTGVHVLRAEDLSAPLKDCVRNIADKMATDGNDFVEISTARKLVQEHFGNCQPPAGRSWLDVFIGSNLFRRDPPPYSEELDPLNPPSELIRFSFQRFQDFLMADTLVEKVAAPKPVGLSRKASRLMRIVCAVFRRPFGSNTQELCNPEFQQSGPLNFIFYDCNPEKGIRFEWAGLVGALSTIYPEKLGVEFAKVLPDWKKHWEQGSPLQKGFEESFKWRRLDAFNDDTVELLNRLDDYYVDNQGLLLEVSMTVGHPFNGERLHEHLKQFELAERDSYWTRWVNHSSREELSQVNRIISWALSSLDRKADQQHMQLASLVLAWCLSSSYMTLRDRATKALTTLFLKHQDIFEFVHGKIHDCDDPYIIERIYAAAFGACCIDQNPDRLESYSQSVFVKVFADGEPPVALLTRDYALGIIELAASKNVLGDGVRIGDCYHPFGSEVPVLDLTKEQVEEIAKQRGGKEIFRSASSEWGDYGKYSIPGRVRNFLTTSLSESVPISKSEIKQDFVEEVISPFPERVTALEDYEKVSSLPLELSHRFVGTNTETETVNLDEKIDQYNVAQNEAQSRLEELLDAGERKRLAHEYLREGLAHEEYQKVNVSKCRLWITKRAYELGWTEELFPKDGHTPSYSRHDNDLERIGKKYQRIALDELQARLADNFWTLEGWQERPHIYKYSHHEYRRNIEPTILPNKAGPHASDQGQKDWISEPKIVLPEVFEAELKRWPFSEDPTSAMHDKLVRVDADKKRWLVLYEFNHAENDYEERESNGHGKRYEEFRFFYCVFLKKGKTNEFIAFLDDERSLDVDSFKPRGFTDGPYLGEAFWRDTWNSEKFGEHLWNAPSGYEFAIPVACYHWESHLDKTLPDGFSNYMPQKWFADELSLNASPMGPQYWTEAAGNIVIQAQRPLEHQTTMVIDEAVLHSYAEEHQVEPVWLMIAERNTWSRGDNDEACWRRSEGAIWLDGKKWRQVGWNKDTKR